MSVKIDAYQRDYIRMLAKARIGGTTEREVLWWLLQYAINKVITEGYVQKHVEMMDILRTRSNDR